MDTHTSTHLIALGVAAIVAASCNTGLTGPNGAVAAIHVTAAVDSAFALGDTVPFHATATDRSGATLSGVTYTWTSSAPAVATVSKDGLVVAVGNGVATIQAAVNGVTGSAPFAVRQVPVGLAVALTHDTIATIGHTVQALAHRVDANDRPIPGARVTWTSSNPAVVTVNDSGVVRGIANGQAVVRAEAAGLRDSITVTMHQYPGVITQLDPRPGVWVVGHAGLLIPAVTLAVEDSAYHRLAADSSTIVRAGVYSGAPRLDGRLNVPMTGGRVTFDSLSIGGLVGTRILSFTVQGTYVRDTLRISIYAGPVADMYIVGGNDQSGPAGSVLEFPLKVKVVDAYGNGLGAIINWTVISDSGAVGATPTYADGTGLAVTNYRLGLRAGTDTVYAESDNTPGSPVMFVETVTLPSSGTTGAPRRR